jgi:hypothetical protein
MAKKRFLFAAIGLMGVLGLLAGGCLRQRILCSTAEQRADFIVSRLSSTFDLSEAQLAKVNTIKNEFLERIRVFRGDRESTYGDLIKMARSETLSRSEVDAFIARREAKIKEIRPFLIDKIVEFHDMLTPAQRNILAGKIEKLYHYCD